MRKHQLPCCALNQFFDCDGETPIEEIKYHVKKLKRESLLKWNPKDRRSGETACFVITTPHEEELAEKLESVGFKMIQKFNRRNGYPQVGKLKMWFLDLTTLDENGNPL